MGEREEREEELREARREWKGARIRWEREWWEAVLDECDRASGRGDTGGLYRELRKLEKRGQKKAPTDTTLSKEDFKTHFEKVSHARFENTPEEIEEAVGMAEY